MRSRKLRVILLSLLLSSAGLPVGCERQGPEKPDPTPVGVSALDRRKPVGTPPEVPPTEAPALRDTRPVSDPSISDLIKELRSKDRKRRDAAEGAQ